ncbi:kinetochore-associated Ndc80 complex subunit spc25 [Gonapodya sp. JEL0774]|nr:kinetochore-associated Ndc80 complex subunit spc25 [Gonapodya sp. JEL0774]
MLSTPLPHPRGFSTPARVTGFPVHQHAQIGSQNSNGIDRLKLQSPQIRSDTFIRTIDDQIALLDGFTMRVKAVSQDRNFAARKEFAALAKSYAEIKKEIADLEAHESDVSQTLHRQNQEIQDASAQIELRSARKSDLESRRLDLVRKVADLSRSVEAITQDLHSRRTHLRTQVSKALPETQDYERVLGMKILTPVEHLLTFVFTRIDEHDLDREYSFTVDLSKREYEITSCTPPLPTMPDLVRQLNENRDFYGFVRVVRKEFGEVGRARG